MTTNQECFSSKDEVQINERNILLHASFAQCLPGKSKFFCFVEMNDLLCKYFLRYISVHVAPVSPAFNNSTLSEQIAHSTVDLYLEDITVVPTTRTILRNGAND